MRGSRRCTWSAGFVLVAVLVCGWSCSAPRSCEDSDDCFRRHVCRDGTCVAADPSVDDPADTASVGGRGGDGARSTDLAGGSCVSGQSRRCGTEVGACVRGKQSCRDGAWGPCEGGVAASKETCNGVDDDCDGEVDEGVVETFYLDGDGDGYGTTEKTRTGCTAPSRFSEKKGDCDDDDPEIHPNQEEFCNGADDDCDGVRDEGCPCTYDPCEPRNIDTDQSCDCRESFCEYYDGSGVCSDQTIGADGACEKPAEFYSSETGHCDDDLDNDCDSFTDGPGGGDGEDFDC